MISQDYGAFLDFGVVTLDHQDDIVMFSIYLSQALEILKLRCVCTMGN
jgi:hypothetical protein